MSFSNNFLNDKWSSYSSGAEGNPISELSRKLEGGKYNGLVDIASMVEDPDVRFKMHEKLSVKNGSGSYFEALNGTWEWNVLAQVYFSEGNMNIIQNGIRAGVYKMSNGKINVPNQNVDALQIIMRSIYLQHAEHYPKDITKQVEYLNSLVLDYAVSSVYNEAISYMKYVQDQSTLVMPFDRPLQNDRAYKQLEPKYFL